MSKFEAALISRIIDTGDLKPAADVLTVEHFFQPDTRTAWSALLRYKLQHGDTPSREVFSDQFPDFEFESLPDPVTALVEKVQEYYIYNQQMLFMEEVARKSSVDVMESAEYIAEQAGKFRTMVGRLKGETTQDITQQAKDELLAYHQRKTLKGVLGLPWPWARLNKATFGILNGTLSMFYARPKSMKTWLLLYVLQFLHYQYRQRPILFTREMTVIEMRRRWCALFASIDYGRFMQGKLTTGEEHRFSEAMEAFEEQSPVLIDAAPGFGREAADYMIAKAKEVNASVIGVDGVYLYGNRQWDVIAEFTSALKQGLLVNNLPGIGTTQGAKATFSMGKKGASNADDVAYGDSMLQDCDQLIKVAYVKEDKRLYASVPAIREGEECMFSIWAKPAYDFSQAFSDDIDEGEKSNDDGDDSGFVRK